MHAITWLSRLIGSYAICHILFKIFNSFSTFKSKLRRRQVYLSQLVQRGVSFVNKHKSQLQNRN